MKPVTGLKRLNVLATALLLSVATITFGKTTSSNGLKTVFFNSFEVKVVKSSLEFTWVCTEYNNKTFVIEHSEDGFTWETVAVVDSKRSVESLEKYSYKSTSPVTGKHFYRIRHLNVDDIETGYSAVRTITIQNESASVVIWPNPASDQINIGNNVKGVIMFTKARVYDLTGKLMIETQLRSGNNTIAIANLPVGAYLIQVENESGAAFSQKIIKQ